MQYQNKLGKVIKIIPFLTLFLCSCQLATFERKIVNEITNRCKEFPCIIQINEITEFEWSKLYVVNYGADVTEIEKVEGISIPERTKFKRKIIFTKNGQITHYEELPTHIGEITNNQIFFDNIATNDYEVYTFENAKFEVQKHSAGNIVYYQLNQKTF